MWEEGYWFLLREQMVAPFTEVGRRGEGRSLEDRNPKIIFCDSEIQMLIKNSEGMAN